MRVFQFTLLFCLFLGLFLPWDEYSPVFNHTVAPTMKYIAYTYQDEVKARGLYKGVTILFLYSLLISTIYFNTSSRKVSLLGTVFTILLVFGFFAFSFLSKLGAALLGAPIDDDGTIMGLHPFEAYSVIFLFLLCVTFILVRRKALSISREKFSFIPLIIILLVFNLAGGGYMFYLRSVEYKPYVASSALKTVTSQYCDVSFQYPDDWEGRSWDNPEWGRCEFYFKYEPKNYYFRITSVDTTFDQINPQYSTVEHIQFGDAQALVESQKMGSSTDKRIYLNVNNKVLETQFSEEYEETEKVRVFKEILNSLTLK